MKRKYTLLLLTVLFLLATGKNVFAQHTTDKNKIYAFENGQWFDGKGFVNKTMYVKDGIFTNTRPATIDTVVNLQFKFVIPPFSESHTHHLEGIGTPPQELIDSYLKDGVFYVKNPNNIRTFTKNIIDKLNKPNSIDVSFGNGGLTISEGHPMVLFEDLVRRGVESMIGKTERGWFNGKAYYTINNEKDLEDKWPAILADKPDFIKTYLINSDDHGKTSPSSKYKLRVGLDPAMLPVIVAKAHKAGLRVATHVETANDFRNALMAGVDELAHMPGFYLFDAAYSNRYQLTEEDAKLSAAKNVFIVTTLMTRSLVEDKSLLPIVKENQKKNLLLLKKHGAKLAIGSDHSDSPVEEIKAIRELDAFTNLELLILWCENSARCIFPQRKIGLLAPGYEASFLVLEGNPVTEWSNTGKIISRFKQGFFMKAFK